MKKRLWTILLIVVLAVSACTPQSANTDSAAGEQSAQAEGAKTTVRVWTHRNDSFNAGYEALADAYMVENPNVEIVFETFDYDSYIQTLQTAIPAKPKQMYYRCLALGFAPMQMVVVWRLYRNLL